MRISRPGSSAALPQSLVLIGTGKLGGAMLEGWLRIGIDPKGISPIDPKPSDEMVALANEKGMRLNPSAKEIPPCRCRRDRDQTADARYGGTGHAGLPPPLGRC